MDETTPATIGPNDVILSIDDFRRATAAHEDGTLLHRVGQKLLESPSELMDAATNLIESLKPPLSGTLAALTPDVPSHINLAAIEHSLAGNMEGTALDAAMQLVTAVADLAREELERRVTAKNRGATEPVARGMHVAGAMSGTEAPSVKPVGKARRK